MIMTAPTSKEKKKNQTSAAAAVKPLPLPPLPPIPPLPVDDTLDLMPAISQPRDRFLRQSEVLEKIGFGESMLNDMIADGSFPKPARIGARAVRWSENEIDAWIAARLAERNRALMLPDDPAPVPHTADQESTSESSRPAGRRRRAGTPEKID